MKLGGWSRLCIVFSALYLVAVVAFVWADFPQPDGIQHTDAFYDRISPEVRQKILDARGASTDREALMEEARRRGLVEQVEMPNRHLLTFSKDLPQVEKEAATRAYWAIVEQAVVAKRIQYALRAVAWWVGPVIALYFLGWAVGWIYRGFKRS